MVGKTRKGIFPYRGGYRTDVSIGVDPATGKRRRVALYGRTEKEVDEARAALLVAHGKGLPVELDRQTVEQYLTWWLAEVVAPTVRPRTYTSYQATVRLHIVPTLGRLQLRKLAPEHVQMLLNRLATSGSQRLRAGKRRDGGALSPRSVQYVRAVLRMALNHALRWGKVARNVAELVDSPAAPRHRVRPLDPDGARALLKAARGDRLEALYSASLALGLRQGEALGLRWSDLDLDAGTLLVAHQLQRLDGRLQLVAPKTEESRRALALPAAVVAALRAHHDRQQFERQAAGSHWHEHDLVFTTPLGAPLDPRGALRHFKALLGRAALPDMRFHDLRHSCASLLYAQGVELATIKTVLGHTQIGTTADIYTHIMPALKRATAAAMDAILAEPKASGCQVAVGGGGPAGN